LLRRHWRQRRCDPPDAFTKVEAIELAVAEFGNQANIGKGIDRTRVESMHAEWGPIVNVPAPARDSRRGTRGPVIAACAVLVGEIERMPIGQGGLLRAPRAQSRTNKARAVENEGGPLRMIALDAVPGFFAQD